MFLVFLLYALFASIFTFSKTALEFTDPLFFVGSRMFVAGFLLLVYQFIREPKSFAVKRAHFLPLFLLAFFNIYLTNVCEVWGLKYLTSAKTCFIYSLSPFLSTLLAYFMFSEKLSSRKWLGLIIGFLGFIPILVHHTASEEAGGHFLVFSWPELAVFVAAFASVYGWILLCKLVRDLHYSPTMANGTSMLMGGTMALFHSFLVEDWNPVPVTQWVPFLECSLCVIVISNFTCYNLYGVLLRRYSAPFMSFAGFMTPLIAALFGWIFLDEVVALPFYLSAIIVFFGLVIFYQEELKSVEVEESSCGLS